MGLFSVLSMPWSDDFGYLAWRQAIEVPSEAVDLTKPGAYTFQIGGDTLARVRPLPPDSDSCEPPDTLDGDYWGFTGIAVPFRA